MSYPSGTKLVAAVLENKTLPLPLRISAARSCRVQRALLRVIEDSSTPPTLRAVAVLRYDQLGTIKQRIKDLAGMPEEHATERQTARDPEAEEAFTD